MPSPGKALSAQPLSAAEFGAQLKAQQAKRLRTQAEPPVPELAAGTLTCPASEPAAATPQTERPHRVIKLGIDVHLDRYVVVRQIDGGAPQPPQRFSPRQFLEWAKKQTALAQQVYSCYEAGPFGYRLHRG